MNNKTYYLELNIKKYDILPENNNNKNTSIITRIKNTQNLTDKEQRFLMEKFNKLASGLYEVENSPYV